MSTEAKRAFSSDRGLKCIGKITHLFMFVCVFIPGSKLTKSSIIENFKGDVTEMSTEAKRGYITYLPPTPTIPT